MHRPFHINRLHINGSWIESETGTTRCDLYRGTPFSRTSMAGADAVDSALAAAAAARQAMEASPRHARAGWLRLAAAQLTARRRQAAEAIVAEAGKPITLALSEVDRAIETLGLSANAALQPLGEVLPMDASPRGAGRSGFYTRVPIGVVAAITPYNAPLNLMCHKIGPALAAGNAVIVKPDPRTPSIANLLVGILHEAGVPNGAVNLVHGGRDVGQLLVDDGRVNLISFTGSRGAALAIASRAGLKRTQFELGGNAGNIVCADADLDNAATQLCDAAFAHSGQSCIGVQRIYVAAAVFHSFAERFLGQVGRLVVGDPWDPATHLGPMIDEESVRRVLDWIGEARAGGARLLAGGSAQGLVLAPTVLGDLRDDMRVVCEEVFGPVVTLHRFDALEDAIESVNASRYGLQAGIFTAGLQTALVAAARLRVGGVVVNGTSNYRVDHQPYGGVKDSGLGREGPRFAVEAMSELRMVVLQ